jgi:coenzyme F420-0:L-glutamate ligase/coenzyme F420-1:gamma-L-glutamate ligase
VPSRLVLTALPGLPLVQPGDDLASLILQALPRADLDVQAGDVLAVTQKIVSKAEGRLVNLAAVRPSPEAERVARQTDKDPRLVEVILRESEEILRTRPGLIITRHRLGFVCANAGVDHSNVLGPEGNAEDWVLMLPRDPDHSARVLRQAVQRATGADVGILIVDSHGRAWRQGVVGVAIGVAGFPALVDLRGRADLFGYRLRVTQVGLADGVAGAASILMGESDEGTPVVHVRGLPYPLREGILAELLRPPEQDLFL